MKTDYETVAAADFAAYSYARQTQKVDEALYRYTVTVRSTPDVPFDLTDWTHLSVVFKGTALTVYINGALAYETASAFAGATDSGFALWIGGLAIILR